MKHFIDRLNHLARSASEHEEIPIAALVIHKGEIVGEAVNARESENIIHGHAEILAINQAAKSLGSWKLPECEMIVSTQPCLMCYGAIRQSRIKKVYVCSYQDDRKLNHPHYLEPNDLFNYEYVNDESANLIKSFFAKKRGVC